MHVSLYIGQSLDGFIADVDGGTSWMETDNSASDLLLEHYENFLEKIDILVMGYNTYRQIDYQRVNGSIEEWPYGKWPYPNHISYVITNKKIKNLQNIIFVNDIEDVMKIDKNIWLLGGANVAKSFIEKGYVDEYILTTVPVCIGDGIKLFDHIYLDNLEITNVEQLMNYIIVTYKNKN